MGVYSVRDKTWKQYGDFYQVGSAAFSPDGKKVAFIDEPDSDRQTLMILDHCCPAIFRRNLVTYCASA
jgi:Tol biopolymer transport system component